MVHGVGSFLRVGLPRIGLGILLAFTPAGAQQTGTITGRAVQADNGAPLVGAAVSVEGTLQVAITNASGRYILPGVPTGQQSLSLTYIGHETQTESVVVPAGGTAVVDFSAPVAAVALEGLTVIGARAMVQAEALSRQKNAPNIINVVASDQIGRFPDASAPEAVQRIPGIAIARDQGEGRYIQIRGGSAANTQVTFNGVQIPSPEGDVRQIALDAVPVDILESIEVSKALLPDMDADAIGGSVNLATRSAPSARLFSLEAAGGFAPIREEPSGSGTVTFGDRVADGKLGFLINGSWSRRDFGSDDVEPSYDLGDAGLGDDVLEELEVRHYSLWRQRIGGTASFDYRLDEASSITLTGIFTNLTDTEQRRRLISVLEDDALEWQHKNREENLRSYGAALTGEHLIGSAILDYQLALTRSEEETPFDTEIGWVLEGVTFSPQIGDRDNVRSNPSTIAGDYLFAEIEPASSQTEDTDQVAALNLSIPFATGSRAGKIKFGGKVRSKNKVQNIIEEAFELSSGDIILGSDYGSRWGVNLTHPGNYPQPAFGTTPGEVTDFVNRFGSVLDGEVDLEAETEDYDLDERVIAGYVMAELNLTSDFMLLPGVRYEHTNVQTSGNEFDADTEVLSPVADEHDYGQLFPMLHARWSLGPATNLRGAFTTAMQRPNFFDLVPFRVRDGDDLVLGNPDLEPTISRGLDVLVEHYDERIGVLSAGLFYKDLTDPIFLFVEDNAQGGETEQPRNGESGWIRGFEVAVQRRLGGGFGVYGNYTFTDSEAELPGGRAVRLQGQSDHVFNAALSYERSGFSGQFSANFHNDYVDEYADDAFEDVYIDRHLQFDVSASYDATERSRVFLEVLNITNEPLVAYQGVKDRPIQMEFYEPWARMGVRMAW